MRCDNCGWDNSDTAADCIKCKTPLQTTVGVKKSTPSPASLGVPFSGTIPDVAPGSAPSPVKFAGTIADASHGDQETVRCTTPGCGYENSSHAKVCQLCKKPLQAAAPQPTVPDKLPVPPTVASKGPVQPTVSELPPRKMTAATIDPYRMKAGQAPACYLKPVPREKEKLENNGAAKEYAYNDEPIALNRRNLEDKNNSITSKVQAELVFEDGKWYLSDRSELHSTFIAVGEKMELKEGDTILMGDRKFIFTTTGDQLP